MIALPIAHRIAAAEVRAAITPHAAAAVRIAAR
jgi:hypothetical protein